MLMISHSLVVSRKLVICAVNCRCMLVGYYVDCCVFMWTHMFASFRFRFLSEFVLFVSLCVLLIQLWVTWPSIYLFYPNFFIVLATLWNKFSLNSHILFKKSRSLTVHSSVLVDQFCYLVNKFIVPKWPTFIYWYCYTWLHLTIMWL